MFQNHVIDPTYFYDCIEEFSFNYTLYVQVKQAVDDYGNQVSTYDKQIIRGSLQSNGKSVNRSKDGNTIRKEYDFYCKSLYRINIGDVLEYKNNFYLCKDINNDFDEYGVRGAKLQMISLTAYKDLSNYVKYLKGEKLI